MSRVCESLEMRMCCEGGMDGDATADDTGQCLVMGPPHEVRIAAFAIVVGLVPGR